MKQSLKYGLLLVLALLIHSVTCQTMENNCKELSPTHCQGKCYVSQNHPIQNALARLYNYYSTQSSDLSHMDAVPVPTDKSISLFIDYLRGSRNSQSPPYDSSSDIPKYLSDPISHYIYGLRKIVI